MKKQKQLEKSIDVAEMSFEVRFKGFEVDLKQLMDKWHIGFKERAYIDEGLIKTEIKGIDLLVKNETNGK